MKRLLALIFIWFTCSVSEASASEGEKMPTPNEKSRCTLLHLGASYLYSLPNAINNAGSGIALDFGVNLARFSGKNLHLGLFGSVKIDKGPFVDDYSPEYINDLSIYRDYQLLNTIDSGLASHFINRSGVQGGLLGSYFLKGGISFYVPVRYFPLLKFYVSKTTEIISARYFLKNQYSSIGNYVNIGYYSLGVDASFRLREFFHSIATDFISIGIYYQYDDIGFAQIENTNLYFYKFIRPGFFEKYSYANRFGFKVAFEIY